MNFDSKDFLKESLNKMVQFGDEEIKPILDVFTLKKTKKKEIIAQEGKIVDSAFFIQNGALRLFFSEKGTEVTGNISTEGEFLSSHESFFSQIPSKYNVESVEDCILYEITTANFLKIASNNPKVFQVAMKILEQRLSKARETIEMLVTLTPQERYERIMKDNPEWINRIPLNYIASYIGISPVSISRIRNRLFSEK
jgi:CRP-like cAMP-binding protein